MSAFPPLPYVQDNAEISFLLLINVYLGFIRRIRHPLPYFNTRIRTRLLDNVIQEQLEIKDLYRVLESRPYEFWILSGETIESFSDLILEVTPLVHNFRYGDGRLSLHNRLLLTLIWLRQYPTYTLLSVSFGVSVSTIGATIDTMWMILWEICAPKVLWPDINTWRQRIGTWPEMPYVVGCIDGTSHEILIPSTEPQEEFYSGHRKYHCMHTQIVIDNQKNICYVHSGFLGHDNDAFTYRQMKTIGPGFELDFPNDCFILADSIYPNAHPLVTPYKSMEIVRQPQREQRRRGKFNRMHRRRRVYVEHVIKELKTFRVIGSLYRHPRWNLTSIVELCAGLSKRRADLICENYS